MFEFHGWIVLRYHAHDTNDILQDKAYSAFNSYLKDVDNRRIIKYKTKKRARLLDNHWIT